MTDGHPDLNARHLILCIGEMAEHIKSLAFIVLAPYDTRRAKIGHIAAGMRRELERLERLAEIAPPAGGSTEAASEAPRLLGPALAPLDAPPGPIPPPIL